VEMTRKKVRSRLSSKLLKPCPYCHGTGRVYSETMIVAKVEKEIQTMVKASKIWGVVVEVHPDIARLWSEDGEKNIEIVERYLECRIGIKENYNLHIEESEIHALVNQQGAEQFFLENK